MNSDNLVKSMHGVVASELQIFNKVCPGCCRVGCVGECCTLFSHLPLENISLYLLTFSFIHLQVPSCSQQSFVFSHSFDFSPLKSSYFNLTGHMVLFIFYLLYLSSMCIYTGYTISRSFCRPLCYDLPYTNPHSLPLRTSPTGHYPSDLIFGNIILHQELSSQ